jgi:hypothetical protein
LPKILTPSRKDAKFYFPLGLRVFALDVLGKYPTLQSGMRKVSY